MTQNVTPTRPKENQVEILVAATLAIIWLVYSGPFPVEIPGFFPLLATVIVVTPLFLTLVNRSAPGDAGRYGAIFGIVWFGLNPAIIDSLMPSQAWRIMVSAVGMVVGLLLYQWRPEWRRAGVFLLPVVAAAFCHRAALGFGPLLFAYIWLFEKDARWPAIPVAFARSLPGWLAALPAALPAIGLASAPAIAFDARIMLGARTLWQSVAPFFASPTADGQDAAAITMIFLFVAAVYTARWRHTRTVSFGLWWFLAMIAIVPAEPLPAAIGLALAGASAIARAGELAPRTDLRLLAAACLCFLGLCGAATIQRNVAASDAGSEAPSVQQPAVATQPQTQPPAPPVISPAQPQRPDELLNLSLSLYQAGKFEESIRAAQAALQIDPNYAEAYNNIAAAYSALRRWDESIAAARQALRLKPDSTLARNNLNWALEQKRLGH